MSGLRIVVNRDGEAFRVPARDPSVSPPTPPTGPLSAREVQVLAGAADGLRNAEIAARMGVTADTVKKHMHAVFRKVGNGDRAGAVAAGFRAGWLS